MFTHNESISTINTMCVSVSIVSHGHGPMLESLTRQLLAFPEVQEVILTYNIPEAELAIKDDRLKIVRNKSPRGFGANHNAAFKLSQCNQFCVLNPDVVFTENPFLVLLDALKQPRVSLVVPRVVDELGNTEDSLRVFLTPISILKRVLGLDRATYRFEKTSEPICPDWAAGMFMLFESAAYDAVGGFDEHYFMYCEDADICTRLWSVGCKVMACPTVSIIHPGQRASRKNLRHMVWHVKSLLRYFAIHGHSLPKRQDT